MRRTRRGRLLGCAALLASSGAAFRFTTTSLRMGGDVLPRENLLKRAEFEGVDRQVVARVVEVAEEAIKNWSPTGTEFFMTPPQYFGIARLLKGLVDVSHVSWGGYQQAERRRMFFSRPDMEDVLVEGSEWLNENVVALDIGGQFLFDAADHRDFLGSVLGTGITREKVGDIIVQGERGAQAIVHPSVADYLIMNLESVRTVKVKVEQIPLTELKVSAPVTKSLTSTEASMRLDAVGSAGMGVSRSKMADAIKAGLIFVNWVPVSSSSTTIKEGDVITFRGKGRVEIEQVAVTKNGRFRVNMIRFT